MKHGEGFLDISAGSGGVGEGVMGIGAGSGDVDLENLSVGGGTSDITDGYYCIDGWEDR